MGWFWPSEFRLLGCLFRCNSVQISLLGCCLPWILHYFCFGCLNCWANLQFFQTKFGVRQFSFGWQFEFAQCRAAVYEKFSTGCYETLAWRIQSTREAYVVRNCRTTTSHMKNSHHNSLRKVWLEQFSDFCFTESNLQILSCRHSDENSYLKRPDDLFPERSIHNSCLQGTIQHLRLTIAMFKIQNSAPTAPLDLRLP